MARKSPLQSPFPSFSPYTLLSKKGGRTTTTLHTHFLRKIVIRKTVYATVRRRCQSGMQCVGYMSGDICT